MNILTITGVIVTTCGALILSMAGLIKSMVLGRLDQIQGQLGGLTDELHHIDVRVARIEAQHEAERRARGES